MRIGLTYDLRDEYLAMGYGEEETAEFDRGSTIDAIEGALRTLGHETDRIGHVRRLAARLVAGERWDLVFNIAEGLRGVGRESQVPALLDAWEIPYTFSDPFVSALTLHKGMTKHVLRALGIPTSAFALVESEADLAGVDLAFPLFVKPVAEGTAKGIDAASKVADREQLRRRCLGIVERYGQAALVEPFLPGREFTTSLVGTGARSRAIGTLEITLNFGAEADAYSYVNKERCEELVTYTLITDRKLAARCEELALRTWRGLGCRDGGRVDFRADGEGRLLVLEVNPLPGLHPEHSDLPMTCTAVGMPYVDLIGEIVASACERVGEGAETRSGALGRASP